MYILLRVLLRKFIRKEKSILNKDRLEIESKKVTRRCREANELNKELYKNPYIHYEHFCVKTKNIRIRATTSSKSKKLGSSSIFYYGDKFRLF